MIKYPNGETFHKKDLIKKKNNIEISLSSANRGISFEDDINASNLFYKEKGICLITKRPTPIKVTKVDYSKGKIIQNAYFEEKSTTDYNGVYKGRYIDFEAKSTLSTTSLPLHNISLHQIEHLKEVIKHDGIAFFLVSFSKLNLIFLLDAKDLIDFMERENRKSIPLSFFKEKGVIVQQSLKPRVDYISAIKEKFL